MTLLDIVGEVIALTYAARVVFNLKVPTKRKLLLLAILDSRICLIPLCILHLYYISQQLNSSDPTLTGTYATLTAGIHLTISVVMLISASLKPFMAVYEDGDGFAYSGEYFRSRGKSGMGSSRSQPQNSQVSGTVFNDPATAMVGAVGGGATASYKATARGGWTRMEDPILRPTSSVHSEGEAPKQGGKADIVVEEEFEMNEMKPTSPLRPTRDKPSY